MIIFYFVKCTKNILHLLPVSSKVRILATSLDYT